jgi:D-alanyl-D-alanine carboxypeptidase
MPGPGWDPGSKDRDLPLRGLTSRTGCFIAALFTTLAVVGTAAAAPTQNAPQSSRYASIVVEAETGNVLYERNADLARYPASLTKIMTLYMAFEALATKRISLNDEIPVSAYAAGRDPSRLNLAPGAKLRIEDAIRGMTTKSANDAACALGEALGKGSETRFAEMMTSKAKTLGLKSTSFRNASGLPEEGHVTTARDLALLCRALVRDYPVYYSYFATDAFQFHGTRYLNQNRFLQTYYGADGIKTGFVNASGHNLAASAVRGGKRLIGIVLGGDTQSWTREHATRLLDVSYAKIDPSLVMVASNAGNEQGEERDDDQETPVQVATALPPAAPAANVETYATPAGAVTVTRPGIQLPNPTANLAANAAAVVGPSQPVTGGDPSDPADPTAPRTASAVTAPAAAVATAVDAPAFPASPGTVVATATPATEEVTEDSIVRELLARGLSATAAPTPRPSIASAAAAPSEPSRTSPARNPQDTAAAADEKPAPQAGRKPADEARAVESPAGQPEASASPSEASPESPAAGTWSVQVGLFRDATVARRRGEEARNLMPMALRGADLVVDRALDGVHVTSRIGRLSERDARAACSELQRGRVPCVVVPPGRPLVVATN